MGLPTLATAFLSTTLAGPIGQGISLPIQAAHTALTLPPDASCQNGVKSSLEVELELILDSLGITSDDTVDNT